MNYGPFARRDVTIVGGDIRVDSVGGDAYEVTSEGVGVVVDNLDTITGGYDNMEIRIKAAAGHTITVRDASVSGATAHRIYTPAAAAIAVDNNNRHFIALRRYGTDWFVIS